MHVNFSKLFLIIICIKNLTNKLKYKKDKGKGKG